MPASSQEHLLHRIAPFSFGLPFIFEPDDYTRGKGRREPADLAWISPGAVYLFAATSGKKERVEQDKHNFIQLTGWLKEWKRGRPLVGQNTVRRFSLQMDEFDVIVLVSITASRSDHAEVHQQQSLDIKRNQDLRQLIVCVTLPEQTLHDLIRFGGSALDLADFLLNVSRNYSHVNIRESARILNEQRDAARGRALRLRDSSLEWDPELAELVCEVVGRLARRMDPPPSDLALFRQPVMGDSPLYDADWETIYRLGIYATEAVVSLRSHPATATDGTALFSHHDIDGESYLIHVAEKRLTPVLPPLVANAVEMWSKANPEGRLTTLLFLTDAGAVTDLATFAFAGPPRKTSHAAQILGSIVA